MASNNPRKVSPATISANDIKQKPGKYIGYRGFSEWVASDNDIFILRKFSTLTVRVLLRLQNEISELERQLQFVEDALSAKNAPDIHNGSFKEETSVERQQIIHDLHGKLKEYFELVNQHSQLRSRPQVPVKDVLNVSNWFHNNKDAILPDETQYIYKHKDLFTIAPKPKAPVYKSSHARLFDLWRKPRLSGDELVDYGNTPDHRSEVLVALITPTVGLIMLIAPLWILYYIPFPSYRLATITVFVMVFLCFASFTAIARPLEILAATAGYAAILVALAQVNPGPVAYHRAS